MADCNCDVTEFYLEFKVLGYLFFTSLAVFFTHLTTRRQMCLFFLKCRINVPFRRFLWSVANGFMDSRNSASQRRVCTLHQQLPKAGWLPAASQSIIKVINNDFCRQHDAQLLIYIFFLMQRHYHVIMTSVPLFRDRFFNKCLIIIVTLPRIAAPHPVIRKQYLKDT